MMVAVAIVSTMLLALSAIGAHPGGAHPASLALQAALTEARGVALVTGDAANALVPTGATVAVSPVDPSDLTKGSIIRVYRSRPIVYRGPGPGQGRAAAVLEPDVGFPDARVNATFHIAAGTVSGDPPFSILISQSGITSIIAGYAYDPANPRSFATDPGCADRGVTITARDSARSETYPFICRDAVLEIKPHAAS